MSKILFIAEDNETVLKPMEIVTLKTTKQAISLWPGDAITARLKNGQTVTGAVDWSIEPWTITVRFSKTQCCTFDVKAIKSIEFHEYSKFRPKMDRGVEEEE